ncbi:ferritin-like domain-containing protein [Sphingobium sp.]|uniref:ferritin-like domain-containing protein n=1 Tax=Sphingobium sp. TaxID=1912891 RepID=UPI0039C9DE78
MAETPPESLASACLSVLQTAEPRAKLMLARAVARDWRAGRLAHRFDVPMPDYPVRPDRPELLPPNQMPRRGKAGSGAGRIALLHAIAHIEFSAIDLAFDMIGRFGDGLPRAFVDDWMKVGAEEAMHFALLERRLKQLGSHYGALPAHEGLWDAAHETRHDLAARLAVVPLVLEARGLDVTPQMIERLQRAGDNTSSRILSRIASDEVGHVAAGILWFETIAIQQNFDAPSTFQTLVRRHFRGAVKPPFNDSARRQAGLTQEYYTALAH